VTQVDGVGVPGALRLGFGLRAAHPGRQVLGVSVAELDVEHGDILRRSARSLEHLGVRVEREHRSRPEDDTLVRTIRELLAPGLTVEDLHTRTHQLRAMARDPSTVCGSTPESGGFSEVVERRLAALDTEVDQFTRLRELLARQAGAADRPPRQP
jgi:hypothetical protein